MDDNQVIKIISLICASLYKKNSSAIRSAYDIESDARYFESYLKEK